MKLQIKTEFWEKINKEKVHKLTYVLLIISMMTLGAIMLGWGIIASMTHLFMVIILVTVEISYNKENKGEKENGKRKN